MDFQHSQASHCESGVMSNLLRHHGLPLSEPMTFGLSSALSFAYLPIIKINGLPLVAYRMPPKCIIKGLQKPLGLKMRFETFRSPQAAEQRLDALLGEGKVATGRFGADMQVALVNDGPVSVELRLERQEP